MGLGAVLALLLAGDLRANPIDTLTAEEIMERTVAKARKDNPRLNYAYNKLAVSEKLGSDGQVTERKEKWIRIISGKGNVLQIKVNGKPLPRDELQREQAEVQSEDRRMNDSRVARRDDNWERLLTSDLISRFKFTLVGEQEYNGRMAHVLTFKPAAANLPVREMSDRFVNNLTGTIWVDMQDYEIAKADLKLRSEVTLWGGILGSLRKFDYKLERARLEDGVWVNRTSRGEMAGRKFLDGISMRTRVECKDFEKVHVTQAAQNQ